MKKKLWLLLWAELFVLCAVLGFLPEEAGWLRLVKQAAAALFFVPPVVLLVLARRKGDDALRRCIRNLAALSLGLTAAVMALAVGTAVGSEALGNIVHGILTVISAPMICSEHWAASLFGWACLLAAAFPKSKSEP